MSPVSSRTIRMSSPATTSGFRVEALASSGYRIAGRRLAKQAEVLADAQQAALGTQFARIVVPLRTADGAEQHGIGLLGQLLGRLGKGILGGIDGAAAKQPSSSSSLRSSAFSTRTASAMISGPMPSPGNTQIFIVQSFRKTARAARRGAGLRIRGSSRHGAGSGRCRPSRSAGTPCGRDRHRRDGMAIGTHNLLLGQIDRQAIAGLCSVRPNRASISTLGRTMGSRPFLKQLL
jgi:hypothetical protein